MKFMFAVAAVTASLSFPAMAAPFAMVGSANAGFVKTEVVIPPKQQNGVVLAAVRSAHPATHLLQVKPFEYVVPPAVSSTGKAHSDEYVVPPATKGSTTVHSDEYVVPPATKGTNTVHSDEYVVPPAK
jgi:hypothetical protein